MTLDECELRFAIVLTLLVSFLHYGILHAFCMSFSNLLEFVVAYFAPCLRILIDATQRCQWAARAVVTTIVLSLCWYSGDNCFFDCPFSLEYFAFWAVISVFLCIIDECTAVDVDSGQELSKDYDLAGWLVARLVAGLAAIPSCLMWYLAGREDSCSARWRLWLNLSCSNDSKDPRGCRLVCSESNETVFGVDERRTHGLGMIWLFEVIWLPHRMGSSREDSRLDARWHANPSMPIPLRHPIDGGVRDSQSTPY